MNKNLHRGVALLLIPALIADPVAAAAFSQGASSSIVATITNLSVFNRQAIPAHALDFRSDIYHRHSHVSPTTGQLLERFSPLAVDLAGQTEGDAAAVSPPTGSLQGESTHDRNLWPFFVAGVVSGAFLGYKFIRAAQSFDAKLAAVPPGPFDGMLPGAPPVQDGIRERWIEQTPSGAWIKNNLPAHPRLIVFIAPGKMASIEPLHGFVTQRLNRPSGRKAKLRQLWHLDDSYYSLPGGLAYAVEQAYPEVGTAILSSVDEYIPQLQLKMTREQQTARTTEAIQAVRRRCPRGPDRCNWEQYGRTVSPGTSWQFSASTRRVPAEDRAQCSAGARGHRRALGEVLGAADF